MARGSQDLVKKNSKLESFLQRSLTAEKFDRVRGYESCICVSDKDNKAFKYIILSDEWIYLTENPPKSIQNAVHLKDIVSVELINDFPDFLTGEEQKNTQHIAITHVTNDPPRRRNFRRSRRSPRGSAPDLQAIDRSNNSTPLDYASSIDGSEDVGYFTQSMASLPHSRPNSRGSMGSQRDVRTSAIISKKKKKSLPVVESWDPDSALRSIEEDRLENIQEDELPVGVHRDSRSGTSRQTMSNRKSQSDIVISSQKLNDSQTSLRPLPPHPRMDAFETEVKLQGDSKNGAEVVTGKSGCLCTPFFSRSSKSQVTPINSVHEQDGDFSSKAHLMGGDSGKGIPRISVGSNMSPDVRTSQQSVSNTVTRSQSSLMGMPGVSGSYSNVGALSLDLERSSSFTSELSGSVNGLQTLAMDSNPEQRQTVLHIYLLSTASPMMMLIRGAWNNYLIRATLSLDSMQEINMPATNVSGGSSSQSSYREKYELFFNQLRRKLFEPNSSMEIFFKLFTDLKQATEKNFLLKKLFWKNGDIFALMVQQLTRYMPCTEANLHTEDAVVQRMGELEFVILIVTILSLMFRESEILPFRIQALKAERGRYLIDFLMTLTSPPMPPEKQILLMKHWSVPSKSTPRMGSSSTHTRDSELSQLLSEYMQVSIKAVFELMLMAKQNQFEQGEGVQYTINWMVKVIEETKHLEHFVERVMGQVLEIINLARCGVVSSKQAVQLYQQFFILLAILEHNAHTLHFLRSHYQEEFKYFIHGPALARKLPLQFPITPLAVLYISKVSSKVLRHPVKKDSVLTRHQSNGH